MHVPKTRLALSRDQTKTALKLKKAEAISLSQSPRPILHQSEWFLVSTPLCSRSFLNKLEREPILRFTKSFN